MNFLAHLHLSSDSEKVMIGNFIGDFVKGKEVENYPYEVASGIELHRFIDEFTDNHHIVGESKKRLREKYRHYSGVIVDMYYDHFLARNWDHFSDITLVKFAQKAYKIILKNKKLLPLKVKKMVPFMIAGNWLVNYRKIDGISRALYGMSRRTTFTSYMEDAHEDLKNNYQSFEQEFMQFYPELVEASEDFLSKKDIRS